MTFRIYTRTGDRGETGILGGKRLPKSDRRIRALGAVEETNAALGFVLTGFTGTGVAQTAPETTEALARIQATLFEVGAALASAAPSTGGDLFREETIFLEGLIDRLEEALPPLTRFILPGGSKTGAGLHWVRTVARRAESMVVEALREETGEHELTPDRLHLMTWLNRLSDALFVLARTANHREGIAEKIWESKAEKSKGGSTQTDR